MTQRAHLLTDEVARLRLDSECGLVVNAYVVRSAKGVALVDTGFSHTASQLEGGLAELGLRLDDVTDVLYTHTHIDHMGGGAAVEGRWSPRQHVWEGSRPAFGDYLAYAESIRERPEWPIGFVEPDRALDPLVVEIRSKPRPRIRSGEAGTLSGVVGVPFGGVVEVGDLRFVCVDARGHDPHHVAWLEPSRRWLFSGDVVLPVPTPLVPKMGDDLGRWLGTLDRWRSSLEVDWLLPGHGMPTSLYEPSIARSRQSFERVYAVTIAGLEQGQPFDPLDAVRRLMPRDSSRFAARSAVLLTNVEATLHTLEALRLARRCDDGRWIACGALPTSGSLAVGS